MKGLIFVYVMTYGGALVSIFKPYIGFLIYVAWAIIRPEGTFAYAFDDTAGRGFTRVIVLFLLIGWFLNGMGNWKFGKAWPIALCFTGFVVWSFISALQAKISTELAMTQVEEHFKMLLPFLIGLSLINTTQQLKQLVWVMVVCNCFLALRFNEDYYGIPNFNSDEWVYAGWDNNGIALTMVASAGLALFMGLEATKWWSKLFCFVSLVMMMHVVMFSLSRGGMVAMGITGVVAFLLLPKKPLYLLLYVIIILAGIRLAGPTVVDRFMQVREYEQDGSAVSRMVLWGQCWDLMKEYPLLGVGPDNWFKVAINYWGHEKAAHTLWLHVGAEIGFPGLGFLVGFYAFGVWHMLKYCRAKTPTIEPWMKGVARTVVCCIAGFAVAAQFLSAQGVELPYLIILMAAGMLKLESLQASTVPARPWAQPMPYAAPPPPVPWPGNVPYPSPVYR